jgi:hypothetical protein
MRTLTSPVTTEAAASQSGWVELYDFYLKASISTPWGTTSVIRLTNAPGQIANFTPQIAPETSQGTSATYYPWPITREAAKTNKRTLDDTLTITASNVTGDFATVVASIEWRDTPVVIRKIPISSGSTLTANDTVIVFSGIVHAVKVTLTTLAVSCSSDLGNWNIQLPNGTYHPTCRFRWGDDRCAILKYAAANYKTKTVGTGSTTTQINSTGLTEDTGSLASYGTDLVDTLNAPINSSSGLAGYDYSKVKASSGGDWYLNNTSSAWGVQTQGYWSLSAGQAGVANAALQPYINFDFASAYALKLWRLTPVPGVGREGLPKLMLLFNSPDASTWTFQGYFECPPRAETFDWNLPAATSARYWRLCMRSRWANGYWQPMFRTISAYTGGRNYWRDGYITFDPATTTAALRGLSRAIAASASGLIIPLAPLPVAPVAGDTFVISRGCQRTFNACAERRNTDNYGGFPSIGEELTAPACGKTITAASAGTGSGGRYQTP